MYKIKPPEWTTGGCVAQKAFSTPQGWLGLRKEYNGWMLVGVDKNGWKNFKFFKTEELAEQAAIEMYYTQVERWLDHV